MLLNIAAFYLVFAFGFTAFIPNPLYERSIPVIHTISSAQWAKLNHSVGGRLAWGLPLAAPCYSLYNGTATLTRNVTQCSTVQQGYTTDLFIADHYGGWVTVPA